MIATYLGVIQYGFSLLFGVALSVCYAGIEGTPKNNRIVGWSCVTLLLVQTFCWWFLGLELTTKLYPLIIHLPLILLLIMYFKRPWLNSTVSVLAAYLCCQVPRWISMFWGAVFNSVLIEHISYILAVLSAYYLFKKYIAGTLRLLMERSAKFCTLLGVIPLLYYLFDYITTIYTDLLYQGANGAVQFMPSIFSIFYLTFGILYNVETQNHMRINRERDMLAARLRSTHSELASLRRMQNIAASYRHDMRHHFAILQGMAVEGNLEMIKTYLSTAQSDIESITPIRYCENETVNLILSTFSAKANQAGVTMTVDAELPVSLPLSDTELCSLLSNGLENAISAASACLDAANRTVSVKAEVINDKMLTTIKNSYTGAVAMKDGLPQRTHDGQGYGVHSITAITHTHGGQSHFSTENGVFTLKIMLPLCG